MSNPCRRSSQHLRAALLAAAASLACACPVRAAEPQCWSPEALAVHPGDTAIQRGTRAAYVSLPKRELAAASPIALAERLAIRRVTLPPGVKLVALTFDLCEQPSEIAGYQGAIVDYLRREKVRATFFAGGKWMLTHRERTQQLMSDPLFEIGNHAWEHRNLRLLQAAALTREIAGPQLAYEQVRAELGSRQCLGPDGRTDAHGASASRLSLFRFPYGACNDPALAAVGDMGLRAIQWDVSSGDPWPGQTPDRMVRAVVSAVRPGSIVLFHANGRGWHTADAIRPIVERLRAAGYRFVTVSELLASGEPVYSRTCYDSRPGDTDRYDALARRVDPASSGAAARTAPAKAAERPKL